MPDSLIVQLQNLIEAPLILSFDTATLGGSVCLSRGDRLLGSITGDPQISHSHSLLRDINLVLETAGLALGNVELFAAAAGPGSFTGLRIGLATVKALAMTLNRPCAGIPTLQAIAHAAGTSDATVAALPAGRGEVFAQLLFVSPEGVVTELDAPAPLSPNAMIEKYGTLANLVWAGQGAQLQREPIRNGAAQRGVEFSDQPQNGAADRRGWVLAEREAHLAQNIAALARQRFQRRDVDAPDSLQAIYVRLSDAELKAKCR